MPVEIDSYNFDYGTREMQAQKAGDFEIPLDYAIQQSVEDTWSRFGYKGLVDYINQDKLKNQPEVWDKETDTFVPNKFIDSNEAKERFGVNISAGNRISEKAAENFKFLNDQYLERQETLSRGPQDMASQAAIFGATFASQFLDPLNLAAGFVPFVGLAREASIIGKLGTGLGRAAVGATEGALGNALLEPLNWGVAREFDYDYSAMDTFTNIAIGAAIGGIARPVVGAIGDAISSSTRGHFSSHIDPEIHAKAVQTSLGQMLSGQRVEITPLVRLAIDEKYPNLRDISAIRYIKSAKDSAAVFEANINEVEGMIKFQDDLKDMLTQAEQKVLGLTKQSDILEAQKELGTSVNDLKEMLSAYKDASKNIEPGTQLSDYMQTIAVIEKELAENESAHKNLLDGRRLVKEGQEELNKALDEFETPRASLEIPDNMHEGQILNIEKQADSSEFGLLRGASKLTGKLSEPDKELLRRGILAAQDLNQIPEMTPDKLIELSTSLSSHEGQWWYEPKISREITEYAAEAPKVIDKAAVTESMKKVEGELKELEKQLDIANIDTGNKANQANIATNPIKEALKPFDERITESNKVAKAFEAAGTCIMENLV